MAVAAALAVAGCTMKNQEPPPLTGPSEFATSINLTATPDVINQDGASQSVVNVHVRDINAQPVPNVSLRADIFVGGIAADFGRLSARNIATDSNGRASVVYTAPAGPVNDVDNGTVVSVAMTPLGTNFGNSSMRFVNIRLVPPGVILPPNGTPVPNFTFAPNGPIVGEKMIFDASSSTDPDGNDTIASYHWSFTDGDTRSGKLVTIAFTAPAVYAATLTVTDSGGLSASITKTFTVGPSAAPTASFIFSPTPVVVGATVFFNASASTAPTGRTIVSYAWDFGDGTTATGVNPTHIFGAAGTYQVTLTVTDDTGRTGTVTVAVTVT